MYLPQEAHKSFRAALAALAGVVSRSVADAVKKGSQIADRLSITISTGNKKGLDSSVFTIRENH